MSVLSLGSGSELLRRLIVVLFVAAITVSSTQAQQEGHWYADASRKAQSVFGTYEAPNFRIGNFHIIVLLICPVEDSDSGASHMTTAQAKLTVGLEQRMRQGTVPVNYSDSLVLSNLRIAHNGEWLVLPFPLRTATGQGIAKDENIGRSIVSSDEFSSQMITVDSPLTLTELRLHAALLDRVTGAVREEYDYITKLLPPMKEQPSAIWTSDKQSVYPFCCPSTSVRYVLPATCLVSGKIYDVLGRLIDSIPTVNREAGEHVEYWEAADSLKAGIYFMKLEMCGTQSTQKILLLR